MFSFVKPRRRWYPERATWWIPPPDSAQWTEGPPPVREQRPPVASPLGLRFQHWPARWRHCPAGGATGGGLAAGASAGLFRRFCRSPPSTEVTERVKEEKNAQHREGGEEAGGAGGEVDGKEEREDTETNVHVVEGVPLIAAVVPVGHGGAALRVHDDLGISCGGGSDAILVGNKVGWHAPVCGSIHPHHVASSSVRCGVVNLREVALWHHHHRVHRHLTTKISYVWFVFDQSINQSIEQSTVLLFDLSIMCSINRYKQVTCHRIISLDPPVHVLLQVRLIMLIVLRHVIRVVGCSKWSGSEGRRGPWIKRRIISICGRVSWVPLTKPFFWLIRYGLRCRARR